MHVQHTVSSASLTELILIELTLIELLTTSCT